MPIDEVAEGKQKKKRRMNKMQTENEINAYDDGAKSHHSKGPKAERRGSFRSQRSKGSRFSIRKQGSKTPGKSSGKDELNVEGKDELNDSWESAASNAMRIDLSG